MTRRDLLKLGTLSYADLLLSLQSPIIALPLFPDGSKTTAKETPLREIPGLTDKDELPPQLWERLREATVKAFASNLGADHGNMGSAVHIGNRVLLTNRHVVLDENNNNRQLPFILVGHNSYDWARVSRVWQHPSQDLAVLVHEPYSYIDADQPFGLTANPVAQKPLVPGEVVFGYDYQTDIDPREGKESIHRSRKIYLGKHVEEIPWLPGSPKNKVMFFADNIDARENKPSTSGGASGSSLVNASGEIVAITYGNYVESAGEHPGIAEIYRELGWDPKSEMKIAFAVPIAALQKYPRVAKR